MNQFINGRLYSWSSIEVVGAGLPLEGIAAINYSDGLEPGTPHGRGPLARGYTLGMYSADGSIEVQRDQFDDLVLALGGVGFMTFVVPFFVQYFEPLLGVRGDTVVGRIKKNDTSNSSGSADGTTVKMDMSIIVPILWNGLPGVPIL